MSKRFVEQLEDFFDKRVKYITVCTNQVQITSNPIGGCICMGAIF